MTRPTLLIDAVEKCVSVTIDANLLDLLGVSTRSSFLPEFVTTPRVVVGQSSLLRCFYRIRRDIREHQDLVRLCVLCNRRNQAVAPEIEVDI